MVEYTPRSGIPYPSSNDSVKPQSRDLVALALAADAGIGDAVATAEAEARTVDNRVTGIAATMSADLAVQREHYEGMLTDNGTAYDVAVAQGYEGTRTDWLASLEGPEGPEGPAGGTAVTDPQIASMVQADTATKAALRDGFVERRGKRGATRKLYVRATGSDSNPGTSAAPFREIRAAVDSLSAEMPDLRGEVVIDVGPGSYKGGVRTPVARTPTQDAFLTIRGPAVGGHPNTPTATISHAADTSASWGVLAENGWWIWVEDIKISGPFSTGLDCRSDVTLQRRNVHVDGAAIGVNVTARVMDNARGGIIENCTQYGVQEMYHVIRTYSGGPGGATIYRNNPFGVYSKAHSVGHMDYVVFEGNAVAVHLDRSSANLAGVSISGSSICGVSLKDSEVHGGVTWGAGNGRRVLTYGPGSSESDVYGWGNDPQATLRTGITPPILIGQDYSGTVVSGTTTATQVAQFTTVLKADRYAVKGRKVRVKIVASLPATMAGALYIRIRVASSSVVTLALPAGAAGGSFIADMEMVCTADGNNQLWSGFHMTQNGNYRAYHSLATRDMVAADRTVDVQVQPFSTADSITIHAVEVYG